MDLVKLKQWFAESKRDLPWRRTGNPYAIWVSEVMLQQTRVAVVVPYYVRWMKQFPSVRDLASAAPEEVIKAWEGLGYYSRARHLHEGAKYVVEHFNGILPDEESQLQKIKGLGPYTVGAILSFAFRKKIPAVDGNVVRVLARYFESEEDISKPSVLQKFRRRAFELLPDDEHWIVNEALIELGATVCRPKPICDRCPVQSSCIGLRRGSVSRLPFKSKKIPVEHLYRSVAVIRSGSSYLIKKGEKGKVMSDLYEFPFFETIKGGESSECIADKVFGDFGVKVELMQTLPEVKHSFTRYLAHLYPVCFTASEKKSISGYEWREVSHLKRLPFSSGHRRILETVS